MNDQAELTYLTGIFDGEGWVQIRRDAHTPSMRIGVSMCCEEVISMLHVRWGGRVYNYAGRLKSGRPFWEWKVSAADALPALIEMKPFVVVKRPIIEWAIELASLAAGSRTWAGGRHGHPIPEPYRTRRFELAALIKEHGRYGHTPNEFHQYLPKIMT